MSSVVPRLPRNGRVRLLLALLLLWTGTMLTVAGPSLRAGALPWSQASLLAVAPWGAGAPETLPATPEGRAWQGPRTTWLRGIDALSAGRWPWAEPTLAAGGIGGVAHGRSGIVLDPLLHAALPAGPGRATLLLGMLRSLLAAVGMVLLGLRTGLGPSGALVAGLVAGLSPWAWHAHLLELDGAVAAAPWLVLAVDTVRRGAWWRGAGLVALLAALAWLTAAPWTAAVVLAALLAAVLGLSRSSRRAGLVLVGGSLLAMAIVPVSVPGWIAWNGVPLAGRGPGWPGIVVLVTAAAGFIGLPGRGRWLLLPVVAVVPWVPALAVVALPALAWLSGRATEAGFSGRLSRWLPVLVATEAVLLHLGTMPAQPWTGHPPETPGIGFMKPLRDEGRIETKGGLMPGSLPGLYGLEEVGGEGLPDAHRQFLEIGGPVGDMLAVRQTALPPGASIPEGALLGHDGADMRVAVRAFARPWVRFTGEPVRILPAGALRMELAKASPGGPDALWLPEGVAPGPVTVGAAGLVTDLVRQPGFWSFRVSSTGEGHAVAALRFDPAWRVLVRSGEIVREMAPLPAYGGLVAVPVSSGVNRVELRHDPSGLAGLAGQGVATAILAMLVTLAGWLFGHRPAAIAEA